MTEKIGFELVKDCLETKFKRMIESEVIPALDLKDGAIAKNAVGHYKAFTIKASDNEIVIVLNQRDDGDLTYEGEYKNINGAWKII